MAYQQATKPAPMFSIGTLKTTNLFDNFFNATKTWSKRRQTANELHCLTARELADIGITRGDISSIVSNIKA